MRQLGWLLLALGLVPVGCNADILSTCVDDAHDADCSSMGDVACSCEGYELECRKARANDFSSYDYSWFRSGGKCGAQATAASGGSAHAGSSSAGSPPMGGSGGTGGASITNETVRVALMDLTSFLAGGLGSDPHSNGQVVGFAAHIVAASVALDLKPKLDLPIITSRGSCGSPDGSSGSACVQDYWTFDWTFSAYQPNVETSYHFKATALGGKEISLEALSEPTLGNMRFNGFVNDGHNAFYFDYTINCEGSGIVVDMLSYAEVSYAPHSPLACQGN